MSRLLLIFLLAFLVHSARGQDSFSVDDESGETAALPEESTHLSVAPKDLASTRNYQEADLARHEFDKGRWKVIVGDVDYAEKPVENKESEPFSLPWAGPVLKIISYVVIIGLVVFLVYYITKNVTFDLRIERSKLQTKDVEKPVDNINNLDIDALLEQAKREGNFRLAIRLYYLGLLKKLDALGMIVWKRDKTNRDYLSEVFLRDFHYRLIQRLTVSYEAVWYGEHTLRGESLEKLSKEFESLYRELNIDKTP